MEAVACLRTWASPPIPTGTGLASVVALLTVSSNGYRHVWQWNLATSVTQTLNSRVALLRVVTVIGPCDNISTPSGISCLLLHAGHLFVTNVSHSQ